MMGVSLQASPSSELLCGLKPNYIVGGKLRFEDKQLNSVVGSSSCVGRGVLARNLLGYEDSLLIGLNTGQSRGKNSSKGRRKNPGWRGDWSSSHGCLKGKIVRAVNGESRFRATENGRSSEKFSRGYASKDSFVDQGYDRGDSFSLPNRFPEGGRGGTGNVRTVIRDDKAMEEYDSQRLSELRRRNGGGRYLVQFDDETGAPEGYGRGTNRGTGTGSRNDAGYARERVSTRARRDDNVQVLQIPTQAQFDELNLEKDDKYSRNPFSEDLRESEADQEQRPSAYSAPLERVRVLARDNGEVARALGSSGRDKTGALISDTPTNLSETSSYDGSEIDRRRLAQETEIARESRREDFEDDDQAYAGGMKKITENFPYETELPRSKLKGATDEELWQRRSRRNGESYSSDPVSDSRSPTVNSEDSTLVSRKSYDYDRSRASQAEGLEAVREQRISPAGVLNERNGYQNIGRYEASRVAADEDQDQVLLTRGSIGRDRVSSRNYWEESAQEVLTRGAVCAKQVIDQTTAEILGFVTQLWVDTEILKVVALEVRPTLLFGDFDNIMLRRLSKVGDVILINDEGIIFEEVNRFNCFDMVGNDLFTENGSYLGKVRDYNFSLDDGAVLSIEFDSFGVPLIPSPVVSTYSLTADEVIEMQEDSLLVRKGAEKRVRKLTKGLFSRPRQSSMGSRGQRTQVPLLTSSRSSSPASPEVQYMGPSMGQASRRVGSVVDQGEYTAGFVTPGQPLKRETIYSDDRRSRSSDQSRANRFESEQAQDRYPDGRVSARHNNLTPDQQKDYQTSPPLSKGMPSEGTPEILTSKQPQHAALSTPEESRSSRGLPMSYRTTKRRV